MSSAADYDDDDAAYENDSEEEEEYEEDEEEEEGEYDQQYSQQYNQQQSTQHSSHEQAHQPPPTSDLEDEEEMEQLTDALELNKQLKTIMASGLDPATMQQELQALMAKMSVGADPSSSAAAPNSGALKNSSSHYNQQQQQYHQQQQEQEQQEQQQQQRSNGVGGMQPRKQQAPPRLSSKDGHMRAPPKNTSSGKTFSQQESVEQARDNQRLLRNMIRIQTKAKDATIGGYNTSIGKGSAVTNLKSSNGINRAKKVNKQAAENRAFLSRLQNVKGTLDTKKMKKDADRNASISAMRRTVGGGGGAGTRGSNNVFGGAADKMRVARFKAPPSVSQPVWES